MTEPLENLYFNWLCAKAIRTPIPTPSTSYLNLLRKLHHTEFVWFLSGDDNRAADGLELRDEFLMESGYSDDPFWQGLGCSVLEMLLAFARRCEFAAGESVRFWFMKFLEHLDLHQETDASNTPPEEIDDILTAFIWRTYRYSGQGGLFPLRNPKEDQREVEIWYQFCEWLVDQGWPL